MGVGRELSSSKTHLCPNCLCFRLRCGLGVQLFGAAATDAAGCGCSLSGELSLDSFGSSLGSSFGV